MMIRVTPLFTGAVMIQIARHTRRLLLFYQTACYGWTLLRRIGFVVRGDRRRR